MVDRDGSVVVRDWAVGFMLGVGLRRDLWGETILLTKHRLLMVPILLACDVGPDFLLDMSAVEKARKVQRLKRISLRPSPQSARSAIRFARRRPARQPGRNPKLAAQNRRDVNDVRAWGSKALTKVQRYLAVVSFARVWREMLVVAHSQAARNKKFYGVSQMGEAGPPSTLKMAGRRRFARRPGKELPDNLASFLSRQYR